MRTESVLRFEDDDFTAAHRELARNREANHTGAYDGAVYFLCHGSKGKRTARRRVTRYDSLMLNAPHSTTAHAAWDPQFCDRSPMFEPLREAAASLRGPHWPTLDKLQRLVSQEPPLSVKSGMPLMVVREERTWTLGYEARAYLHGELQVRSSSWHDLFNVLVWRTFPHAKAALNHAHYESQHEASGGRRGPRRDALTVFDESGVIVACSDGELLDMVRGFRWHELFWTHRERVLASIRFIVFGHALYEKALAPYVGLTGHAMLFEVEAAYAGLSAAAQAQALDERVAARVRDPAVLASASALSPLPVLGVPGWWADNERAAFYANERYFRPGRSKGRS
jgi:hypothetical protein